MRLQTHNLGLLHCTIAFPQGRSFTEQKIKSGLGKEGKKRKEKKKLKIKIKLKAI